MIKAPFTLQEELKSIKSHINQLLTYFSFKSSPDLTITATIIELDNQKVLSAKSLEDLLSEIVRDYPNSILSLGLFTHILQSEVPLYITKTIHGSNFFVFFNYDLLPEHSNNNATIIAYLRELCNWLLIQADIVGIEEHDDKCLRTYDIKIPQDQNLTPNKERQLLINQRYHEIPFNVCNNCSEKLTKALLLFGDIVKEPNLSKSSIKISPKVASERARSFKSSSDQYASKPSPSNLAKTESDFPSLTREEQNIILNIANDLHVHEPVHSEEYLELRQRFLKKKISEDVFRKHFRRLAF